MSENNVHGALSIPVGTFGAAILLLAASPPSRGGEFREIKHPGAGFLGPGEASTPPETSVCPKFGSKASVGFPYRNRSLVVDVGEPAPAVHRMVLVDDFSDNGGDSPSVREHGLRIYTSNDNRRYVRYTGPLQINVRSAAPEGAFDAVELNGLELRARYIKLHADLPNEDWDLACQDLRTMVRVYQDPDRVVDVLEFCVERYAAGALPVHMRVRLPKVAPEGLVVRLLVGDRGGAPGKEHDRVPLPPNGQRERIQERALSLDGVPPGPKSVSAIVADVEGRTLARVVTETFVCTSIIRRTPDDKAEPVVSRPGQTVIVHNLAKLVTQNEADPEGAWAAVTAQQTNRRLPVAFVSNNGRAPALRVPLPVKGWHAVAIGLVGGDARVQARILPDGEVRSCQLEVWGQKRPGTVLGEAFVGCADLDGAVLEIAPVKKAPARVAFVLLLGLSAEEVVLAEAAGQPCEDRRVIIHSDGYSGFYSGAYSTKEKLHRVIDRFAGSRIYSFDWCVGGSTFTYGTRIGTVYGSHVKEFWRKGDRRAAEALQRLLAEDNDPLHVIVDRARAKGVRINATLRMNANYGGEPAKAFNGEFYWQHLEWRIVNREGKRHPHLSYAYPEVRDFRLSIIREAAGYGVDGIHLNFLRHPPFFGYDPLLVDAFRERFGAEPDAVPGDKRWYQLRADIMTDFVRRVRQTLDEVGHQSGRRIALSATMEYQNCLEQGLDVERWVKEGLVDLISPGVHGLGGTYFPVRQFAEMTRGTQCKLFPMLECTIRGHDPTPESERGEVVYEHERMTLNRFRRRFLELHREGAEGVYPFNGGNARLVNTLSHIDGLRAWERFEKPLVEWFSEVRLP